MDGGVVFWFVVEDGGYDFGFFVYEGEEVVYLGGDMGDEFDVEFVEVLFGFFGVFGCGEVGDFDFG